MVIPGEVASLTECTKRQSEADLILIHWCQHHCENPHRHCVLSIFCRKIVNTKSSLSMKNSWMSEDCKGLVQACNCSIASQVTEVSCGLIEIPHIWGWISPWECQPVLRRQLYKKIGLKLCLWLDESFFVIWYAGDYFWLRCSIEKSSCSFRTPI